ncbi:MAG: DUF411 domain-containing protein [Gemmatimonadaceae bacterium]
MANRIIVFAVIVMTGIAGCSNGPEPEDRSSGTRTVTAHPVADGATAGATTVASNSDALIPIKVYKDPDCGCCKEWVKHLEANGFKVETMDMPDLSLLKEKYGVKRELQACHTAIVGDYVVEGHVPADVIKKMLKEKPAIAGLAVPGMPMGSPGMDGPARERYSVLTFDHAGRTTVYAQR